MTLDNLTDRALFQLGTLSSELRSAILHHVPCRPKRTVCYVQPEWQQAHFLGKHYHAHSGAMEIERRSLCFSPTMNNQPCESRWLLGDPSAMPKEWDNGVYGKPDNGVYGKPKNFGVKIKSILPDVLGHMPICPSMVRHQLIMFVFIPSQ